MAIIVATLDTELLCSYLKTNKKLLKAFENTEFGCHITKLEQFAYFKAVGVERDLRNSR